MERMTTMNQRAIPRTPCRKLVSKIEYKYLVISTENLALSRCFTLAKKGVPGKHLGLLKEYHGTPVRPIYSQYDLVVLIKGPHFTSMVP